MKRCPSAAFAGRMPDRHDRRPQILAGDESVRLRRRRREICGERLTGAAEQAHATACRDERQADATTPGQEP